MSEANAGRPDTEATPDADDTHDPYYLANMLRAEVDARSDGGGAPWLSREAVDPATGKPALSPQAAHELMSFPRKGWASPKSIRAIARRFGWSDAQIYVANAVSIGLDPPPGGAFANMLPGWVDQLPASVQAHLREEITLFGRAAGLTD